MSGGEVVSGGAQVETPGGMKGKDAAVNSTVFFFFYSLFNSIWAHIHSLPVSLWYTLLFRVTCILFILYCPQVCTSSKDAKEAHTGGAKKKEAIWQTK